MQIKTTAIIGAGPIGRAIAYLFVLAGFRSILEDVSDSVLAKALAWIHDSLDQSIAQGNLTPATRAAALSLLSTSHLVDEAIRDADLILETVSDELEMKLELFTIFDKFAKPNAIFASTTSALSISDFSDIVIARDRCIGLRFSYPVPEMRLLQIVRTPQTSNETVAACAEFANRLHLQTTIISEPSIRP